MIVLGAEVCKACLAWANVLTENEITDEITHHLLKCRVNLPLGCTNVSFVGDLALQGLGDLSVEDCATGSCCKLNALTFLSFKGDAGLEMVFRDASGVFCGETLVGVALLACCLVTLCGVEQFLEGLLSLSGEFSVFSCSSTSVKETLLICLKS